MISITKRNEGGVVIARRKRTRTGSSNSCRNKAYIMKLTLPWLLNLFIALIALQIPVATKLEKTSTTAMAMEKMIAMATVAATATAAAAAVETTANSSYKASKLATTNTEITTKTIESKTTITMTKSNRNNSRNSHNRNNNDENEKQTRNADNGDGDSDGDGHEDEDNDDAIRLGALLAKLKASTHNSGEIAIENGTETETETATEIGIETGTITKAVEWNVTILPSLDANSSINATTIISFHEYCLSSRDSIADVLTIILYSTVCIIGLFGNTLVIYVVLRFSKMQTVTNIYILNLAIADECFLIGIPFLLYTMRICSWKFGEYMCKAYMVSTSITQFTSSIFLLIMSADRFIAVCHPIASPRYRTIRIAKLISAIAWLTSAILMLPVILFATTIAQEDGIHHSCNIEWPEPHKHTGTTFILYTFFLGFATPLCFILCFYYLVIRKLHAVGRKHKSKEKKRSHRKVTRLVLTVITVYVLCWLPQWISQVALINSSPDQNNLSRIEILIFLLLGCLAYSNSAMNPILYAFLSDNFRKSFSKAFTCMSGHEVNAQLQVEPSVFTKHGGGSRRRCSKRSIIAQTNNTRMVKATKAKTTLIPLQAANNNSSTTTATSSTTTQAAAEKHIVAMAMAANIGVIKTGSGTETETGAAMGTGTTIVESVTVKNGLINTENVVLVLVNQETICATLADTQQTHQSNEVGGKTSTTFQTNV